MEAATAAAAAELPHHEDALIVVPRAPVQPKWARDFELVRACARLIPHAGAAAAAAV